MTKNVFLIMMMLSTMLNAQDLLPELAAPAAQHKAADEALDKQKLEAIALAAKSYVSTLDSIEKAATAKGEIDLVAAVVKEREAVASGALEPDLPEALPKARLQMSRKTLLASVERINADFAKRKKKADADYLRVLALLQPKAAANPDLAKQIAAEKAALLHGGAGSAVGGSAVGGSANGTGAVNVSRGKNVVINGNFEKIGADGKPEGWSQHGCASVEKEDGNTFVRIDTGVANNDGKATSGHFRQDFERPKNIAHAIITAKLRTHGCVGAKRPGANIVCKNQGGKSIFWIQAQWERKDGAWKAIQAEGSVPKDVASFCVELTNNGCTGQIDFDDVEVTFK